MNVIVNGAARRLEDATTLDQLVGAPSGRAVAVNGAVVPARSWAATRLRDDDRVDIVTAHQGG